MLIDADACSCGVYRTNSAYGRWWEARQLLGGLLAITRTLARQVWLRTCKKTVTNAHIHSVETEYSASIAPYLHLLMLFDAVTHNTL